MLLALLLPDPGDPECPKEFKDRARAILRAPLPQPKGKGDADLRQALLRFIADFANWDAAAEPVYLEAGRALVRAAHGDEPPLVVDPFAGGGSIPLEALRLGCEAFASDLNPVACLILKVLLEEIPRHGPRLAEELRRAGAEIKAAAEKELAEFYPVDPDGARPIAYLWARTVRCESSGCGAEIPLVRSFWLSKKASRRRALRYRVERPKGQPPEVVLEVFEPKTDSEIPRGTVSRAKAACPACGIVLAPERVRAQLSAQRGGADVVFDEQGCRASGARLLGLADAAESSLSSEAAGVWFTDPPYYDAVPYADLSDFFFVWLKRVLPGHPILRAPFDPENILTPKEREAVQDETKSAGGRLKDRQFFETIMSHAFGEGRRVLREDGVGCVVFAHKTTEGWEALLSGMMQGGWVITASWPIITEMGARLRARDSAALSASVHLVCRPRDDDAPSGDWGDVFAALPGRVAEWIERLTEEGVRGADLVFACIGPALELFSRHPRVELADGEVVGLGANAEALGEPARRGYLSYVWEAVGRAALARVLGGGSPGSGNGGAGMLEEDARLTALFLWTVQNEPGRERSGRRRG